ncbi:MAG: C39 family peptidase [Eggerthellaceae bacterium]|nr:C39 family peptidase [Eggerthellaceae bacterium]
MGKGAQNSVFGGMKANLTVRRSVSIAAVALLILALILAIPNRAILTGGTNGREGSSGIVTWIQSPPEVDGPSSTEAQNQGVGSEIASVLAEIAPNPRDKRANYTSNINHISQYPELPTGCEVVALTIVLQSMGFSLEKTTIAEYYLDYSYEDFVHAFVGDPFSYEGMAAYPPAIAKAANAFLEDQHSSMKAYDITGTSWYDLLDFVERGFPVIIWSTLYATEPWFTDDEYEGWRWYLNEHCVVLYWVEYEPYKVWVSDPTSGNVQDNGGYYHWLYEECGSMAVVIY